MNNYEKMNQYMKAYMDEMKTYLPIEQEYHRLLRNGVSKEEAVLKVENNSVLNRVPGTLFHGSVYDFDVIQARESTQKGTHVYATDHPLHAFLFAICRNSSDVRGQLKEWIVDGEYHFQISLDERYPGKLEELMEIENVNLYVCDGREFFKPEGESYISREWCSKGNSDVKPIDRVQLNVRELFTYLESIDAVVYDPYRPEKDWDTITGLLGQNYAYSLGTEKREQLDQIYDEFFGARYPEYLLFSQYLRGDIKEMMDHPTSSNDFTSENTRNQKLKEVKQFVERFQTTTKSETGKNIHKMNVPELERYMKEHPTLLREDQEERIEKLK